MLAHRRRGCATMPRVEPSVEQIRVELERAALAAEGFDGLLRRLVAANGRPAWLVAVHGGVLAALSDTAQPLAASTPASGVAASDSIEGGLDPADVRRHILDDEPATVVTVDGREVRVMPVLAGPRRVGMLVMEEPVGERGEALLRASRLAFAIEATRRDAVAAAVAENASRVIDELRYGSLRDPAEVQRSASRFGVRLDAPHAAAVFAYDGTNRGAWSTGIRWIEMPVRVENGLGWTVLGGDIAAELHRIRRRLQGIVGDDAPVLAASGPVVADLGATARSFAEAEIVLAVLRGRSGDDEHNPELTHEALGLGGLLLSVAPERLRQFVDAQLGPILDCAELVDTLAAWYGENGSRIAVADRLHVHRNTVGYRIGRIRELLDADPFDPWTALQLRAALEAREILAARDRIERTAD
jgi:PucR C-terminal helix-turn-helix domain/GGDEF-like domain